MEVRSKYPFLFGENSKQKHFYHFLLDYWIFDIPYSVRTSLFLLLTRDHHLSTASPAYALQKDLLAHEQVSLY